LDDVVVLEEVAHELEPAADIHPGVLLPGVEAEGHGAVEGEGGILADIVVARGLAGLDGAVLHGVQHLQAGHDLARRERPDLELPIGRRGDALAHAIEGAEDRVQVLRIAGGEAPFDLGQGLGDGGLGKARGQRCNRGGTRRRPTQKFPAFHGFVSPDGLRLDAR
jgi:hypothetical protein